MTLPKISVWSQFRNSARQKQIEQYRKQVNALDYPPNLLRFYLCEGDSDDDTLAHLQGWAAEDQRLTIIHHDTGIPHYAHSTRQERMNAVSINGNIGWDAIAEEAWGDYALMLESDLLFKPDLLKRLIDRRPDEADIFSPFVYIQTKLATLQFYDIWAFRKDGKMFRDCQPEFYFAHFGDAPFELDSVGSVCLFRMELITGGLRLGGDDCILGMCNEARARGYKVFTDPDTFVLHPKIEGVS